MDKIKDYQTLVKRALTEYASLLMAPPKPSYEVVLVFDDEHNQYLLRRLGWGENSRIRQTDLHLAIRDGKIWIEEDWTEEGIATYLLEHGVPNHDIVLGFQPPQMRPFTEFATA
jgi:hypothetical protein